MALINILDAVEKSITEPGGILDEVGKLMNNTTIDKQAEIFKLVGVVIKLIFDIIKATVAESAPSAEPVPALNQST